MSQRPCPHGRAMSICGECFPMEPPRSAVKVLPEDDAFPARLARAIANPVPGRLPCFRCQTFTLQRHATVFRRTVFRPRVSCAPLCEECWQDLGEPRARRPFYRALWFLWTLDGDYEERDEEWAAIEAAVMAGR